MNLCVIIAAAGSSSRYMAAGAVRHKLEEDLGGKIVLQRTVEAFTKHEAVRQIIVAGPNDPELFAAFKLRHVDRMGLLGAKIVQGGRTHRYESILAAMAHVPAEATHIAVHDAARPCVTAELLDRLVEMAGLHAAVVPAIACPDTIKRVRQTDEAAFPSDDPVAAILGEGPRSKEKLRVVEETLDRAALVLVQTPQFFEAGLLRRAYGQADLGSTDDAALVERLGERVAICQGDPRNIKITTPQDLAMARAAMGFGTGEQRPSMKRF